MVDVKKYPRAIKLAALKRLRSKVERELDIDLPPTHERASYADEALLGDHAVRRRVLGALDGTRASCRSRPLRASGRQSKRHRHGSRVLQQLSS